VPEIAQKKDVKENNIDPDKNTLDAPIESEIFPKIISIEQSDKR
jgi:hypothetical protein